MRSQSMSERDLSVSEEIANSITHGVGLIASIAGLPILLLRARSSNDASAIPGAIIFGVTLILLYATSTVYHALPLSKGKRLFRVLDHSAIYLLIAGTYTPFALGPLRGAWGWTLLALIWGLALVGIGSKVFVGFTLPHLSTGLYLLMGWLIVIAIKPLVENIPLAGLLWLTAGGLAYTGGVAFYNMKRVRYNHMIWHLFVAAGSVCHFIAVLGYAIPA
jgi:hemolysin III